MFITAPPRPGGLPNPLEIGSKAILPSIAASPRNGPTFPEHRLGCSSQGHSPLTHAPGKPETSDVRSQVPLAIVRPPLPSGSNLSGLIPYCLEQPYNHVTTALELSHTVFAVSSKLLQKMAVRLL